MGRLHHGQLAIFFKDNPDGIDLGNVELKHCTNYSYKFTVHKKDYKAQFLIFFAEIEDNTWYFMNGEEFKRNIKLKRGKLKRSVSTNQLRKHSYFITDDLDEVMRESEEIINEPEKHCKWLIE